MAAQKSKPSDLYKCVYSFLLENKFTKAAQQFLKQTQVVSGSKLVRLTRACRAREVVQVTCACGVL